MVIFDNIDIDTDRAIQFSILKNINNNINKAILKNIDIYINIERKSLRNIDIDKEIIKYR